MGEVTNHSNTVVSNSKAQITSDANTIKQDTLSTINVNAAAAIQEIANTKDASLVAVTNLTESSVNTIVTETDKSVRTLDSKGSQYVAQAGSMATAARKQALLAKHYADQEHGQSDVTQDNLKDLEYKRVFPKLEIGNDQKI